MRMSSKEDFKRNKNTEAGNYDEDSEINIRQQKHFFCVSAVTNRELGKLCTVSKSRRPGLPPVPPKSFTCVLFVICRN